MARVAFIGLGNMGGGMAANLAQKGHDVRAFDLSAEALWRNLERHVIRAPDGCAEVGRALVAFRERFALEVSSPGIPRPLTKPAHYERFRGREVDVRLHAPLDGRRRIRGELLESDAQRVVVRGEDGALEIPFAAISRAHLVEEL